MQSHQIQAQTCHHSQPHRVNQIEITETCSKINKMHAWLSSSITKHCAKREILY